MLGSKNPMTQEGYEELVRELDNMVKIERPKVIQAISEGREHGDLSENAEYKAAKEKQAQIEAKIAQLESIISSASIIAKPSQHDKVQFGNKIKIVDINTDSYLDFYIVGDHESDIKKGKISVFSPVARSLIGKSVGDIAKVSAPNGIKEYEIVEIS